MRQRSGSALLAGALLAPLLLTACQQPPGAPPSGGLRAFTIPRINLTVGTDPVVTAVTLAASNLAEPGARLGGRPALAAQTVAQYEFATIALNEPRFIGVNPMTQPQMARGRVALRKAVGIAPDAPPRQVIDAMTELAGALDRGNLEAAGRVLQGGAFVRPAREVLATLDRMPPVPDAARAIAFADQQLNRASPMGMD